VEWIAAEAGRTPAPASFVWTGRKTLVSAVAFFAVVAGVNAIMLTSALRTMPGFDARNGYDPSQRYNAEIAAARRQAALGLSAVTELRRTAVGAELAVELSRTGAAPVGGLTVAARLEHPAARGRDIEATLVEVSPGRYAATLPGAMPGVWTLDIVAREAGGGATIFRSRDRALLKG
jgi:nitrogen fixation protein FixH